MLQLYATSLFHHPFGFEQLSRHKSRPFRHVPAIQPLNAPKALITYSLTTRVLSWPTTKIVRQQ